MASDRMPPIGVPLECCCLIMTHQKLYQVYPSEGLLMKPQSDREPGRGSRTPMPEAARPNARGSLDILSDSFFGASRRFRVLTVTDDRSRENLRLVPDTGFSGARIARELDALVRTHGKPDCIVSKNGAELTGHAILTWADQNAILWFYVDPGKPQQNVLIEGFNGHLRDELLNEEIFDTLDDARRKLALWRCDYNTVRPHSSLSDQTPAETHRMLEQSEGSMPGTPVQTEVHNYQIQTRGLSLWKRDQRGEAGHSPLSTSQFA